MANAARNRALLPLLWAAAIVTAVFVALSVRSLTHERVAVRVAPVTYQTLLSTVSTNGKVEPVAEYQAHAPSASVVQKIYVEVNQHVSAGTPLIKLDDSEAKAKLASANATLSAALLALYSIEQGGSVEERTRFASETASARLEQQQATSNLAITRNLLQRGSASESELAAAQQRLRTAEITLESADQRLKVRYGAADVANAAAHVSEARASIAAAQSNYADANKRSPINGTVYSIPVSEYDFVPAGEDLMDIADLTRIQVRAYFDEPEIGKLARGQAVKIIWDAKPGSAWHGHIDRAPTTVITYNTRNVGECIITVDDAKGDLLPNTNVTVTVTQQQRLNVLSIPREALHAEGASKFVYRIVNGKLAQTPVQVDVVNLTSVQVTSGLTSNDVVVLGPTASGKELTNGLEVKQVE